MEAINFFLILKNNTAPHVYKCQDNYQHRLRDICLNAQISIAVKWCCVKKYASMDVRNVCILTILWEKQLAYSLLK